VIGPLSATRMVVAPDQRGFGRTAKPYPPRMSRTLLARDLEATLDALGLEIIDLAGHDWGGAVASTFAFRRPDRVRRLVLIDTTIERVVLRASWHLLWFKIPRLAERSFATQAEEFVRGGLVGLSKTPGVPSEDDLEHYVSGFRDPSTHATAISLYRHALPVFRVREDERAQERFERISAAEIRAAWGAGVGNHPLWDEVVSLAPLMRRKRFPKPTLWIYASALGRPNAAFRAQFVRAFPELETRELDCGHWIPEERPAELVALLEAFLSA
jgi:pimeloyl-ACP methyl ester carboxylesterase